MKMIKIKPFKALRPKKEWVAEVASLPYDVMSKEEAKEIVRQHPHSFLNIDKPEIHVEAQDDTPYLYARNLLDQMIKEEIFIQDSSSFYLYEQACSFGHQYGLACLVSSQDYQEGRIKRHEQTRQDKEKDRFLHISYCKAHTGPIFLIEDEWPELGDYLKAYASTHIPLYDLTLEDEVMHRLYSIKEERVIHQLIEAFNRMNALYIADGHHRAAAAVQVAQQLGASQNEANDFLAVIFPKEQLCILPYHRMIKDESGYTKEKLFEALSQSFVISEVKEKFFLPTQLHELGMCYQKRWYRLQCKSEILDKKNAVKQLDVSILQDYVLKPVFKIENPRTDTRIGFLPGSTSKEQMIQYVEKQWDILFTLYPTAIESLIDVAKEGEIMPPKSTWFEPKLRSGLLIHRF